jgi:hypothetical protein
VRRAGVELEPCVGHERRGGTAADVDRHDLIVVSMDDQRRYVDAAQVVGGLAGRR